MVVTNGLRGKQQALQAAGPGPPPPTGQMGPPMGGPEAGGMSPVAEPLAAFAEAVMQMPPEEAQAAIAAAGQMLMKLSEQLGGGQEQGAPQPGPPPQGAMQGPPPGPMM